jgi:hypothetical protein
MTGHFEWTLSLTPFLSPGNHMSGAIYWLTGVFAQDKAFQPLKYNFSSPFLSPGNHLSGAIYWLTGVFAQPLKHRFSSSAI